MPLRPIRRARLLGALSLSLLAACEDAPTGPTSFVQHAAGGDWVAVLEPVGMPRADAWAPYVDSASAARLRRMRDEAGRARSAGRVEEALRIEDRMMELAVRSLARDPDPARILSGAAALEAWVERARARLEAGSYPGLHAAVVAVAAEAEAARAALAAGDGRAAAAHLTRGTVTAREHAPLAVGLRLMAAVEARLAGAARTPGVQRARHLLLDAREGLATGDSVRALRRAVYALQLLDAEGIAVPAPDFTATVDSLPPSQ